ncbi:hypothetical protein EG878_17265, partial [Enterococcus faecalis]
HRGRRSSLASADRHLGRGQTGAGEDLAPASRAARDVQTLAQARAGMAGRGTGHAAIDASLPATGCQWRAGSAHRLRGPAHTGRQQPAQCADRGLPRPGCGIGAWRRCLAALRHPCSAPGRIQQRGHRAGARRCVVIHCRPALALNANP